MSLQITINTADYTSDELRRVSGAIANKSAMHARVAVDAEKFIKTAGRQIADNESNHQSARRLGARPSGHLSKAYQAIEGTSSAEAASLLIPRASRLRAAFGRYVLTPQNGSKFLTIPVAAEAYNKRARQIPDLVFLRVGPRKSPILARPDSNGNLNTLYVLVPKAEIPEQPGLIPFDKLNEEARDSVGDYIDDALEATL